MNPYYVHPYFSTQWTYSMPGYGNPHVNYGHWYPYGYGSMNQWRGGIDPSIELKDYGGKPYVVNIEQATLQNQNYRTALWTGEHLQVTLMSIEPGGDIGLELHTDVDQFIRIEQGHGLVQMGESKDRLDYKRMVSDNDAIMIPAGLWHNVINTGDVPLKLYSIYGPPEHPFGVVQRTKADAMAAELR